MKKLNEFSLLDALHLHQEPSTHIRLSKFFLPSPLCLCAFLCSWRSPLVKHTPNNHPCEAPRFTNFTQARDKHNQPRTRYKQALCFNGYSAKRNSLAQWSLGKERRRCSEKVLVKCSTDHLSEQKFDFLSKDVLQGDGVALAQEVALLWSNEREVLLSILQLFSSFFSSTLPALPANSSSPSKLFQWTFHSWTFFFADNFAHPQESRAAKPTQKKNSLTFGSHCAHDCLFTCRYLHFWSILQLSVPVLYLRKDGLWRKQWRWRPLQLHSGQDLTWTDLLW